MKKSINIGLVILAGLIVAAGVAYTQLTFFVIQPIGALPEGKTVIIGRLSKTEFIDSPDAICERIQNGVSLLCRIGAISGVLESATILARLPYSEMLYQISTRGKTYDR